MENLNEIRQKATDLRQAKKWQEAMELYAKLCDLTKNTLWDCYFYALSLKILKFYEKSIAITRKVFLTDKSFKPNKNLYAQNIYHIAMKNLENYSETDLQRAFTAIYVLLDKNFKYFTYDCAFFYLMKKLESLKKYNEILYVCENITPQPADFQTSEKNCPPFGEYYYVVQVKAHFALGNYNKVIELTEKAFEKIKYFNFDFDVWLRRLKAKSHRLQQDTNKAVEEYFKVLRRKKEWFIYYEIAELMFDMQKVREAEFFAAKALTNRQKPEYKVKLYDFVQKNNFQCADKTKLIKILCVLKPSILQNQCNEQAVDIYAVNKQVISEAQNFLSKDISEGEIIKMFSQRTGLLRNKKQIYFFVCEKKLLSLETNKSVEFSFGYNYDFKTKSVKKCAYIEKILDKI